VAAPSSTAHRPRALATTPAAAQEKSGGVGGGARLGGPILRSVKQLKGERASS